MREGTAGPEGEVLVADDELFLEHVAPPDHPECGERLTSVRTGLARALADLGPSRRYTPLSAGDATESQLARVHTHQHIEHLGHLAGRSGYLDSDTYLSPGSVAAARRAAGAAVALVDALDAGRARVGLALPRPPGHHALRSRGMGFCLFGNVAVAAHYARTRHNARKILIVDWDVHHGNGTQALVENEPDIRFVSMHQWPWYPGTGAADDHGPHRTIWNIPMPPALSPGDYVSALERGIDAATNGFVPELIFISAGFDCLAGDPLGGFTLEIEHIESLTRSLVKRAESFCGGRLVSSLEGGYAPDRVGAACVAHLDALA